MEPTLLLDTRLPRTLDAWVERFSAPEWRGARVEGWLFEGREARRAGEERLRAAGVHATLRSAYKPLVHALLEEVDPRGLASLVLRHPVHPQAAPQRFLLESYPLAALLPGCEVQVLPGDADLHYTLDLAWQDGRRAQQRVFAPNRVHGDDAVAVQLSPCGWLRAQAADSRVLLDAAQATDYELLLQQVLAAVDGHPWPAQEPFFDRLDIRADFAGIAQPLPVGHECMDTHEALHEDLYFSLLELFQRRSGRAPGDRRLQPGQIVPDLRIAQGDPHLRIELRAFEPPVTEVPAPEELAVPLEQLDTAAHPLRVAAELEALRGERFAATSRQGRTVAGVYRPGTAAPVFISGGQHANETSGVIGALRAGRVLQERPDAHFALVPLENPDGYALQRELCRHHAAHMQHAARYTALGDDLEYREHAPWFERAAREQALALSGAQLHVNLHGYPAHEWTRPLSGYVPHGFGLWTIPKGFFLIVRHHGGWQAEARALMERVAQALQAVPGLADYNARQLALYERHAGALPFELLHGTACSLSEVERAGSAPVTLITEFPDETVQGEAFRFAHEVQMATTLMAVDAWQALARR